MFDGFEFSLEFINTLFEAAVGSAHLSRHFGQSGPEEHQRDDTHENHLCRTNTTDECARQFHVQPTQVFRLENVA